MFAFFYVFFKGVIEENVLWNDDLGEWQLKCVAYTGNNMRRPKENDKDKDKLHNLDFNHMFLSYTVDGAQKAMKEFQRGKSGKKKKQVKQ